MTYLKKLFKGMNTLLNKIVKSKKQETKEKYRKQLREKMDNAINDRVWGRDLENRQRERNRQREIQRKLSAAFERQKKMDIERKRQNSKIQKLEKQRDLSNSLLSTDERDLLLREKYSKERNPDELAEINKRLADDKKEQIRRKKIANKQSKDIRNPAKRQKLNEKFKHLNDTIGNIYVEQNDMTTWGGGGILVRDVFLRNQKHTDFSFFLDAVEPIVISISKDLQQAKRYSLRFISIWLSTAYLDERL